MKRLIMICALSCTLLANAASADLIVDTGEPPDLGHGYTLSLDQWLAGEFTLDLPWTLTDVVSWMYKTETGAGDITVAIYGDGGDVPDTGSELYSHTFYADLPYPAGGWLGAEGVSWDLGPGTYWAAFEVRTGSAHFAVAPLAPTPLDNYAYRPGGGSWTNSSLSFATRVYAVPVPGAVLLGILGLSVAGVKLRKFA